MSSRRKSFEIVMVSESYTADLRGRQSVRTTFKLPARSIDALSLLAGQLGIKQKSIVDHLEIRSAEVYFKKAFVYGRSAKRYADMVRARPLSYRERINVYRDTVESCGLSRATSIYLFGLLTSFFFFIFHSRAGRIGPSRDSGHCVPG